MTTVSSLNLFVFSYHSYSLNAGSRGKSHPLRLFLSFWSFRGSDTFGYVPLSHERCMNAWLEPPFSIHLLASKEKCGENYVSLGMILSTPMTSRWLLPNLPQIRYYTLALLLFDVLQIHLFTIPGVVNDELYVRLIHFPLSHWDMRRCIAMDSVIRVVGAISLWSIEVLMQLRVYALYSCSRGVCDILHTSSRLSNSGGPIQRNMFHPIHRRIPGDSNH